MKNVWFSHEQSAVAFATAFLGKEGVKVKEMKEFNSYHPIVGFVFFLFVILFSCVFMHPVCLTISLAMSFVYSLMLNGRKAVKFNLLGVLPMMVVMAGLNPAFNHEGMTILTYLPSGNPLTLESIINGIAVAMMIASVVLWFSCFNVIITSDKIIYLFGKIIPSLSLIFSMVLRFVPKFKTQLVQVKMAQNALYGNMVDENIIVKIKRAIKIMSVMITWSFESAIDTSDSMKSRGYGLSGRTVFSNFKFTKRDFAALGTIVFLVVYILTGAICGGMSASYTPVIEYGGKSAYGISIFAAYFVLMSLPVYIELWEERRWKLLKSKI